MSFKKLQFPSPPKIEKNGSMIPYSFYGNVIPKSKRIQFKLGYFSTNAISTLSAGFAKFIYNNGVAEFLINQFLSPRDYALLAEEKNFSTVEITLIQSKLNDLKELNDIIKEGNEHFFNCLRYLMKVDRLKIIPVTCSDGEMAHYKEAIFTDEEGNRIYINGSCNFTQSGIVDNGESFLIHMDWQNSSDKLLIDSEQRSFDKAFSKQDTDNFIYLDPAQLQKVIYNNSVDKSLQELLDDEATLRRKMANQKRILYEQSKQESELIEEIEMIKKSPRFPFDSPLDYQRNAYENWVANNQKGLFEMATGTGKTLTALYCLIEEYKRTGKQNNIFVVPGEELVRQWAAELRTCNFKNIFLWYSKNSNLKKDIVTIDILKYSDALNIVVTYDSFKKLVANFKELIDNYTVVFDEAHNIGAQEFKKTIAPIEFNKVIGLSATPLRLWDEGDENSFIENLFNSPPPYTFSFSMAEAIKRGFLCPYYYYPFFTTLSDTEFEEYITWTGKIPLGKDGKINSFAAMKRQALLDSATGKENVLMDIIGELIQTDDYKYTLVYCPKGIANKEDQHIGDESRIVHNLGEAVAANFINNHLNIQFFLGETEGRELLLSEFEKGDVDMLFAIKCLDEGVNIPRAQNAIFIASGKNYREFVQRRGRILRKYNNGTYKKEFARIYDILVLPTDTQYRAHQETAKKLIVSEFRRYFEFANLARQDSDVFRKVENKLAEFNLTQYYIEDQILQHE